MRKVLTYGVRWLRNLVLRTNKPLPDLRKCKGPMDSTELTKLSKEELLEKIKVLQEECKSLKKKASIPTSKYEALNRKFMGTGKKNRKKSFSPESCYQRKIALRIAYFGWDLMGLQAQPGLDDTVENILFQALIHTKLLIVDKEDASYSKCGRTDRGVSAFSQVMCLDLRSRIVDSSLVHTAGITEQNELATNDSLSAIGVNDDDSSIKNKSCSEEQELDYCGILNRVLPKDIRVLAWAYADEEFSARFSCTGRVYKYFFPRGSLNIEAMDKAAKLYIGTHDFRNFCKFNVEERIDHVRLIKGFDIAMNSSSNASLDSGGQYEMCVATIDGQGFLYHQVRYMMGILFLIGMGFEDASVITELLDVEKTPRRPQYGLMADYPLVLYDCHFENMEWNTSDESAKAILKVLQQHWTSMAIKMTQVRSLLDKYIAEKPVLHKLDHSEALVTPYNMKDIKDYNVSGFLLKEQFTAKQYKRIAERNTALSLEEAIEISENRKKRKQERLDMENEQKSAKKEFVVKGF